MSNNEHLVITMPDGTKVEIGPHNQPIPTEIPLKLPKIFLSKERGRRLDMIRVINSIFELGFFVDENGRKSNKKDVFIVMGHAMNVDFSNFHNDLSSSLADSTSMNKHLKIFEEMLEMMKKIFNFA
jgi:hypothetical protein